MKISLGERHWKILIWTFVILGFATLLPWNASVPNHLGYYSICSSAPISTIMMLIISVAFYSYWKKKSLWLVYGSVIILLMVSGIFGYLALVYRLPLSSLNVKIVVYYVWSGYDDFYEDNVTRIGFNITFTNPTDWELSFQVEDDTFHINGTKLKLHTFDYGRYWDRKRTIQAQQQISFRSSLTIYRKNTRTEEGKFEEFWLSLMQQSFTLSMSGVISNRYYYGPTIEYSFVVAARTFAISHTYSP